MDRRSFLKFSGFAPVCLCCSSAWAANGDAVPHVCTELAMRDFETALDIAIDENPDNNPKNLPRSEAISLYKKKWNPKRRILNVSFLEEPKYLDKVIAQAKGWQPHIGIRFVFGNSDPDILVAFDSGGSWSYIGTDSRYFASRGRPSMNFGWFAEDTEDSEFSRTTLHEFGHALSLVHEHSHPTGPISWDVSKVYAYYKDRGWNEEMVNQQVFQKYELSQVNGSEYDRTSIMHYPIPRELVLKEEDAVGWNTELSSLDKAVISTLYPTQTGQMPD